MTEMGNTLLYRNFTKEELQYKAENNEEIRSKFTVLVDGVYQILYLDYFNIITKIDTATKNTKNYSLFGQPPLAITEDIEESISQSITSKNKSTVVTKIHNNAFIDSCLYVRHILLSYKGNYSLRHTAVVWIADEKKEDFQNYIAEHENTFPFNLREIEFNHEETNAVGFSLYLIYGDLFNAYNELAHFFDVCTEEMANYFYIGKHDIPYLLTLSVFNTELGLITNVRKQTVHSCTLVKLNITRTKTFDETIDIKEG